MLFRNSAGFVRNASSPTWFLLDEDDQKDDHQGEHNQPVESVTSRARKFDLHQAPSSAQIVDLIGSLDEQGGKPARLAGPAALCGETAVRAIVYPPFMTENR